MRSFDQYESDKAEQILDTRFVYLSSVFCNTSNYKLLKYMTAIFELVVLFTNERGLFV